MRRVNYIVGKGLSKFPVRISLILGKHGSKRRRLRLCKLPLFRQSQLLRGGLDSSRISKPRPICPVNSTIQTGPRSSSRTPARP